MSAFWRHVTAIPVDPIVRLDEKVQADVPPVEVTVEPEVTAVPVRAALTFAMVALSAPNAEIIVRIDETCALVKLAADAIGATASIDAAIASPAAIAATFDFEFIVITIINEFKCT
jgi:hypothetical protein